MATVTKGRTFTSGETVTPTKLNDLADLATVTNIQTADISDSQITTAKIADANVTTPKIADANVTTAKIANGAVTSAKLGNDIVLVPAGAIMPFAMNSAPTGWLPADGTAVSRSTYAALFSAIGTTHGSGDGSTTFNLPDLRGIFIRGASNQTISGITYSAIFGTKQTDDFKAHTHGMSNGTTNFNTTSNGPINLGGVFGTDFIKGTGAGDYITQSQSVGGTETRPANIALLYCIKF